MVDLRDGASRSYDELGLETPFVDSQPWGKPNVESEHFAFDESPFAEHEAQAETEEGEALAWLDLESEREEEAPWRGASDSEDEWLGEEEHCSHCGSHAELEEEELTEEGVRFPSGLVLYPVSGPTGRGEDQYDPNGINLPLLNTNAQTHDQLLSPNLKVRELITSGGRPALVARISPALVVALQAIRDRAGKPMTITSGYRSFKRNKAVYAEINAKRRARGLKPVKTTNSRHSSGQAVDLKIRGMSGLALAKLAIDAAGTDLGIGIAANFIHLDVRVTFAVWDYGGAPAGSIEALRRYREQVQGGVPPSNSAAAPLPAAIPATPILPSTQPVVLLPNEIVRIANQEYARWNTTGAALVETDVAAAPILQQYYREYNNDGGQEVSAANLRSDLWQNGNRRRNIRGHPWSAVFISWVMRAAGAGTTFRYTRGHWAYITTAKRNRRLSNAASPFWAYRPTEVAPQVGDIVCKARSGSGATYDNVDDGSQPDAHGDIVTEVREGAISVVGGNVNQNVDRRNLVTLPDGRLSLDGAQSVYFAVIRCRGAANVIQPAPEAWQEQGSDEAFENEDEGVWFEQEFPQFENQIAPMPAVSVLQPCEQQVIDLVAKSKLPRSGWKDSSRAPLGYLNGMALTFARVYCKFKRGDWYALEMAKAPTKGTEGIDALAHLAWRFRRSNMPVAVDGADTLRHLFVMLFGLGMRESGGKFFEGADRSAKHTNRTQIEAGLFQMSHSIGVENPERVALHGIYEQLRTIPYDSYVGVFAQGLRLQGKRLTDNASSAAGLFRNFCQTQPALCAELAAMGTRVRRKHWGPINRKTVELLPICNTLLQEIQALIDGGLDCNCFLPAAWQPATEPPKLVGKNRDDTARKQEVEYLDHEQNDWREADEEGEYEEEYEDEELDQSEDGQSYTEAYEDEAESGWGDETHPALEFDKPSRSTVRKTPEAPRIEILPGKLWAFRSCALSASVEVYVSAAALRRIGEVDFLVYVHGLLHVCYKSMPRPPCSLAAMSDPGLGLAVEASGRPLVLIIPRLQEEMRRGSWRTRNLGDPIIFNAVIAEVQREVGARLGVSEPKLSTLILAGHSGAFAVINPLIRRYNSTEMSKGGLAKLTHIWPIDTTYTIYKSRFPKPAAERLLASKDRLKIHVHYNDGNSTNDFKGYTPPAGLKLSKTNHSHCAMPRLVLPGLLDGLAKQNAAGGAQEQEAWQEIEFKDSADQGGYGDEAFDDEYDANAELEEALDGFAG
jgi:Uncharacterized protein conserved in bacteria (DUF2272)/Peptidase M15